jgi:hypothetical protein
MMGDTVRSMTLRMPHELYVELCRYARERDLSVAQVVRGAIRKEVTR